MDLTSLSSILSLAIQYGPALVNLVKAGAPVGQAVKEHAPELWAAARDLIGTISFPHPDGVATGTETFLKSILVPHMTTEQEKAWMDRASFSTGA